MMHLTLVHDPAPRPDPKPSLDDAMTQPLVLTPDRHLTLDHDTRNNQPVVPTPTLDMTQLLVLTPDRRVLVPV